MEENKIHVAITHNDFYTEHCTTTMVSICENSPNEALVFHIIDGGLSDFSCRKILEVQEKYGCEVKFDKVDNKIFEGYKKADYYPVQILWTMILPEIEGLLGLDKLIYLDCDLVVHSSLKELWKLDLKDNFIAAVEDANGKKYSGRFLDGKSKFFNTGLMVINCKKWREEKIPTRAVKMALENTGTALGYDQTVLNMLFLGKVEYLNLKWNLQFCPLNVWPYYEDLEEYKFAIKNPSIIHFVGDYKPWVRGLGCFNPKQADYFKYHKLTSYKKSNYKKWLFLDKISCAKGLWAFIKRYPFFFLKKQFYKQPKV